MHGCMVDLKRYRFRHNKIAVYVVGIILTFMTYVLVFHWYGDHFPSRYLSTGRLICYLSHTCKHSWPAQIIFPVISNFFYTLYLTLYVFRLLTLVDESKYLLSCLPMPPRAAMTNGGNEPCSTSKIRSLYCLFISRSFISYALVSSWLQYHRAVGLNSLISKNTR